MVVLIVNTGQKTAEGPLTMKIWTGEREGQTLTMTGITVAIRTGMTTSVKEVEADMPMSGGPVARKDPATTAVGIREIVAVARIMVMPGVTAETRKIILRMNGGDKGSKTGHNMTTRWKKMMGIAKARAEGAEEEAVPPEKMMKACANYLRINLRICTGLKKH
jgi:hypothetical protein